MKKDRLYTVNKRNKKALGGNLFVGGGFTTPTYNNPYQGVLGPTYSFGLSGLQKPQTTVINWSDPRQTQPLMQEIDSDIKSLGDSNVFNQYEGGKSSKGSKGLTGTQILGLASGAASGIGAAFQDTPQYSADAGNGFGLVDNFIAQGTKTKGGTALVNTGASLMNTGLASGNGALMLAGGIAGTLGTLWNAGWGTKKNEKNIASIENNTANMNTTGRLLSQASTTSDLLNGAGSMSGKLGFGTKDLVKGGWFSGGKAKSMGQKYLDAEDSALAFQSHGLATGADNVDRKQDNMAMRNFAAFGGPLDMIPSDNNFGAIEYGFMNDYLTAKRRQTEAKNKLGGTLFAIGGDIQTQGGDYTTGMVHINAGSSHELNPNEGVQVGVDAEGTPNLVEEGETIFNDYVYSARIKCDPTTKEMFHIGKKRDITYAELSKKLEKEAAERPNDPISKAALKVQMQDLAEQQERQKAEMENARVREAFEALTPEEQAEVMNYAQQRDAQEQEAAAQEQAMAEQQMMQEAAAQQQPVENMGQPMSQEEMMQQQMMAQQQSQAPMQMAMGGKVNKFAGTQSGSSKMHNAGTWKKGTSAENWNTYTRGGLRDYLKSIVDRINAAPTEEAKNAIRQEAINAVSEIQQAYRNAYQSNLTPSEESETVRTLQNAFQNRNGNAYFGNIADNIVLPAGHNTGDTAAKGWVDGYWGPRTSIRNWGSTEYGVGNTNYYQDISDLASQAGLTYAPNKDWTYGSKDNPYQLYGLSMADSPTTITENELHTPREYHIVEGDDDYLEGDSSTWNGVGKEIKRRTLPNGDIEVIHAADASAQQKPADKTGTADEWEVTPNYRNEKLRYAGLFGPAVGLGMQALGIGRPDTSRLDAAVDSYRNGRLALADYRPIGNYLTYRPMDIWAEQNRLNANARATDRALMNNSSPVGTRMAGLLANEYNNQLASGQLYRQAQEYNNNLNERVQTFNRGTDQYNADAYNRTALANAEAINRDRQYRTQLGLQAAAQKMDADAGWYNGIYGNVAGLFKGISDLGRENAQHNMIAEMAADGIFGPMSPRTNTGKRGKYLTFTKKNSACKGGKINRKKS